MESPDTALPCRGFFLLARFSYYNRLSPTLKRVYRQSDELTRVGLPKPATLRPIVAEAEEYLAEERLAALADACQRLTDAINDQLEIPRATVRVLAKRPSKSWGELHGLYEGPGDGQPARLTVWMRTAQRRQVVAFKTFIRTLFHELCHHLDYELYELADSLHTEGFFKRESSLFQQLAAR